ncbi:hypothetical protein DL764_011004 [Monosporascus ibericus]|uniref:Phosphoinositide phospholipase C n=1 Tax=Monosporascus ibericus TaxID=155417 RepID=A0A4Q4SU28_9PEZI|nr:hypothetical protein DL764_011004 [Monosporascus ibericus]
MRRRLTFNPANTGNSFRALKRAIDLASFIAPTPIHLHGDETTQGENIYLSTAIHRHLKRLYDSLRQGEPTLSRGKFQNFLEAIQGEVAPKLSEERYKFQKFLEVWWLHFGLDAEKPAHFHEKDLTKPLSNYFISSSHNTYLSGSQISGRSSAEAYRRVLRKSCRCIEIDVWDGDSPSAPADRSGSHSRSKAGFKRDHSRGPSGGSLHTAAAHFKETVEGKVEQARQMLGVEKTHSHSPRCSKTDLTAPESGLATGQMLDPSAFADNIQSDRSSNRSRSLPRGEPIVMHGYTFTHPVGFREVCRAVREAAFETSCLPLIVSLEVHADQEQQEVMVQIMKQEWGNLLVDKPSEDCPTSRMPRLEELLNKILVKVKRAYPKPEGGGTSSTLSPYSLVLDDDATGSDEDRLGSSSPKKPKVPICESLSALAIHTHSEHFETFESPAARTPSHIFSISESKLLELHETKNKEMFDHNRHFFMRAYPNGYRFDSSNLDPSLFWRKGVQMVALNWQSCDEAMMLNEGMFSGEHGWVLKPPGYRSEDASMSQADAIPRRTLLLSIRVLAGQHLPLPESVSDKPKNFRPFVKCELHVEKPEERSGAFIEGGGRVREGEYKQKTVASKTDHPDFGTVTSGTSSNLLEFRDIPVVEQLSFVR